MNCNYYTTNRKKGKHLTLVERGKLEILFKSNKTVKEIAGEIGVFERTIYREKKCGMVNGILNSDLTIRNEYVAEKVNNRYLKLQKAKEGILNCYPSTSRKRFLSITSDNGSEFTNAEAIENLGISYFYAHSYCSWERGSNENANKLI